MNFSHIKTPYKLYGFVNEALAEFHFRFKGLSGVKLTAFSFSSCYRSLPVATGGTEVDDVCFDSCCYKSLPVALVAFVFLSATGRYRRIQAVASAFPLLPAGCHYMLIAVLSIYCYSKGAPPP